MHGLDYTQGRPKVVSISQTTGAGGDISATLEPTAGYLWVVLWARGGHTDAAARVCSWYINDQVSSAVEVREGASIAATVYTQLYTGSILEPLVLQYGRVRLSFQALSIAGSKYVGITALVKELRAIGPAT